MYQSLLYYFLADFFFLTVEGTKPIDILDKRSFFMHVVFKN